MKRLMFTAAVVALALLSNATPADAANCAAEDLKGRWDVYGFTDHLALLEVEEPVFVDSTSFASTLDCPFRVSGSGTIARTTCIERFPSTGTERISTRGSLQIRGNCSVTGAINDCQLRGTMTRSKDAILGVAHCEIPQPDLNFPGDFLTLLQMVLR